MAQLPLNNGAQQGTFRSNLVAMFTEIYAFIASLGQANGVASLDATGKVPAAQLPTGGGTGDALTTNTLAQFAATTSLQLKGVISDETGSGSLVFATSPVLVTPTLGTPASGTLTNCSGLPIAGIAGLATGIATFIASATSANLAAALSDETGTGPLLFANSPTLVTPVLGTPQSGVLSNCTGLPINTGISGLATGAATFLAAPSSANLAAMMTDETGTGANVFANSPTLVTPVLGTPASGNLANCTGYPADATKASVTQSLTKSFFVPSPVDGVICYLPVEEGMTITKITAKTGSGTCTLTAAINGTNITGTAVNASSTKSSQTYSAGNVAAAGADFTITASGSSSPVNLGVTVVYTRTLS